MSDDSYDQKYTKPDLRREIKAELMASDKGGRPGQWSARKSQLLVQEYERKGGGYEHDQKDESAQSLEQWTEQEWQTADGSPQADDGGPMKRYLPKQAWDLLDAEEKEKAERKKERGDQQGKQFVENTIAAKAARAYVDHGDASELNESQLKRLSKKELYRIAKESELPGRSKMTKDELAAALHDHLGDPLATKTYEELYGVAQKEELKGRSSMSKSELVKELDKLT